MTNNLMTQDQKMASLDRQLRASNTILCPWCGSINKPDTAPCCVSFQDGLDQRGRDQLEVVEKQYTALEVGLTDSILCPYCGEINAAPPSGQPRDPETWVRPGISPFCCDIFQLAAYAVVERKLMAKRIEHAERIGERASRN